MIHYFFEFVRTPECTKVTPFGIAYRIRSTMDTPAVPAGTLGGFVTEDVQFESIGSWVFDDAMALSNTRLSNCSVLKGNAMAIGSKLDSCVLSDNSRVLYSTIVNSVLSDNATLAETWSSLALHLFGNFFGRRTSFGSTAYDDHTLYANAPCEDGERLFSTCAYNRNDGVSYFNMTIAFNSAMVYIADTEISMHVSELLEKARSLGSGNHAVARLNMYRAIVTEWASTLLKYTRITALPIESRCMLALAQKESWIHEHPWRNELSKVTIK